MSSCTTKLNKLPISFPKYSIPKHSQPSFRCDFGSSFEPDKCPSFISTSNKRTRTIDIDKILSLSNINTFLVRSPQSIHKEKRIEYMMIFRNGSMKDLHRENNLNNLSTMKSSQRDERVQSPKYIKFKVDKYSNELKDERLGNMKSIRNKKAISSIGIHRFDGNRSCSSSSFPMRSKYSTLLVNYSKYKSNVNRNGNSKYSKAHFIKKSI